MMAPPAGVPALQHQQAQMGGGILGGGMQQSAGMMGGGGGLLVGGQQQNTMGGGLLGGGQQRGGMMGATNGGLLGGGGGGLLGGGQQQNSMGGGLLGGGQQSGGMMGGGLMGQQQQQTGGLFGGQNTTMGMMGQQQQQGGGLLGGGQQQNTMGGGLLGGGQQSGGLLGGGGGLMGQQQQQQQQQQGGAAGLGSVSVRYAPTPQTKVKNGRVEHTGAALQAISCMPALANRTLEEIRLEDYMALQRAGSTAFPLSTVALQPPNGQQQQQQQMGGGLLGGGQQSAGMMGGGGLLGGGQQSGGLLGGGGGLMGQQQNTMGGGLLGGGQQSGGLLGGGGGGLLGGGQQQNTMGGGLLGGGQQSGGLLGGGGGLMGQQQNTMGGGLLGGGQQSGGLLGGGGGGLLGGGQQQNTMGGGLLGGGQQSGGLLGGGGGGLLGSGQQSGGLLGGGGGGLLGGGQQSGGLLGGGGGGLLGGGQQSSGLLGGGQRSGGLLGGGGGGLLGGGGGGGLLGGGQQSGGLLGGGGGGLLGGGQRSGGLLGGGGGLLGGGGGGLLGGGGGGLLGGGQQQGGGLAGHAVPVREVKIEDSDPYGTQDMGKYIEFMGLAGADAPQGTAALQNTNGKAGDGAAPGAGDDKTHFAAAAHAMALSPSPQYTYTPISAPRSARRRARRGDRTPRATPAGEGTPAAQGAQRASSRLQELLDGVLSPDSRAQGGQLSLAAGAADGASAGGARSHSDLDGPTLDDRGDSDDIVMVVNVQAFSFAGAVNTPTRAVVPLPKADPPLHTLLREESERLGPGAVQADNKWLTMGFPDDDGAFKADAMADLLAGSASASGGGLANVTGPLRLKLHVPVKASGSVLDLKRSIARCWYEHWLRLWRRFRPNEDPPTGVQLRLRDFQVIQNTMGLQRDEDALSKYGLRNMSSVDVGMDLGWRVRYLQASDDEEGAGGYDSASGTEAGGASPRGRGRSSRSRSRGDRDASVSRSRSRRVPHRDSRSASRSASRSRSNARTPAMPGSGRQRHGHSGGGDSASQRSGSSPSPGVDAETHHERYGTVPGGNVLGGMAGPGRDARWRQARATRPWLPLPPPTGVLLVHPSEGALLRSSKEDIAAVDGFEVRLPSVGSLRWLHPVDLTGVDLAACLLLGEDEMGVDHDVATQLADTPAQIVFEGVAPEGNTVAEWEEAERERYEEAGATDVRFDAGAGTLTVTVPHFSTWARPGSARKRLHSSAFPRTPAAPGRMQGGGLAEDDSPPHSPGGHVVHQDTFNLIQQEASKLLLPEERAPRSGEASPSGAQVAPRALSMSEGTDAAPVWPRPGVRVCWGPGGRIAVPVGTRVLVAQHTPLLRPAEQEAATAVAAAAVRDAVRSTQALGAGAEPLPCLPAAASRRTLPPGCTHAQWGVRRLQGLHAALATAAEEEAKDAGPAGRTAQWAAHAAQAVALLDALWGGDGGAADAPRHDALSQATGDGVAAYRDWRGAVRRRDAVLRWFAAAVRRVLAEAPSLLQGGDEEEQAVAAALSPAWGALLEGDVGGAAESAMDAGFPRLALLLSCGVNDGRASDFVNAQVEQWLVAAEGGMGGVLPAPVLRLLSVAARRLEDEVVALEGEHWLVGASLFVRFGDSVRAPTPLADGLQQFMAAAVPAQGEEVGTVAVPYPWWAHGAAAAAGPHMDASFRALQLAAEAEGAGASAVQRRAASVAFPASTLVALLTPQAWHPSSMAATVPLLAYMGLAHARGLAYTHGEALPVPVLGTRETAVLVNTAVAQLEASGHWQEAVAVCLLAASLDRRGCLAPAQGDALVADESHRDVQVAAFCAEGWTRVAFAVLCRHAPAGDDTAMPPLPETLATAGVPDAWWHAATGQATLSAWRQSRPHAALPESALRAAAAGGLAHALPGAVHSAIAASWLALVRELSTTAAKGQLSAAAAAEAADALHAAVQGALAAVQPLLQSSAAMDGAPAAPGMAAAVAATACVTQLVAAARAWLARCTPAAATERVGALQAALSAQAAQLGAMGPMAAAWHCMCLQCSAVLLGRLQALE